MGVQTCELSAGFGAAALSASVTRIGSDVLIAVWGGTDPHIGSVSISIPRPSLADAGRLSTTTSQYTFLGHKDDIVARAVGERVAAACNRNTVVTAGIHIARIAPAELKAVLRNAGALAEKIVEQLEGSFCA